ILAAVYAALIAAQTAANISMISSRPIPEYWKGVDDHPGGLAMVGERGTELVNTPNGSFLTPNSATLMYLPKHTEVKTHSETKALLGSQLSASSVEMSGVTEMINRANEAAIAKTSMYQSAIEPEDYASALISAFEKEMSGLTSAIINKKEVHFSWNNGELRKSIKRGNSWTEYINNA